MIHPLTSRLAPTGSLRASLNISNALLAQSLTSLDRPAGVSIDLARRLAQELGVPCELVEHDLPGESLATLAREAADIGFLANDPKRAEQMNFTVPYLRIDGVYAAPASLRVLHADEVDRPGMTVVVVRGSAYDLHLARSLKHAAIMRTPDVRSQAPAVLTCDGDAVAAGVKQIWALPGALPGGLHLLAGTFMTIDQCMAVPRSRGADVFAFVNRFLRQLIVDGFVAEAFAAHGITGVEVPMPPG